MIGKSSYTSGLIPTAVPSGRTVGVSCRLHLSPDATVVSLNVGLGDALFTASQIDGLIAELSSVRSMMKSGA